MAVVIRMKRTGRRNAPCYRISVADSRSPRDGRTLDNLGVYDPIAQKPEMRSTLNVERARDWLGRGALPSETVKSLFRRHGVYETIDTTKKVRKRPGRKKVSKKGTERTAVQKMRSERKVARHTAKVAGKRAAAKAAAAASDSE